MSVFPRQPSRLVSCTPYPLLIWFANTQVHVAMKSAQTPSLTIECRSSSYMTFLYARYYPSKDRIEYTAFRQREILKTSYRDLYHIHLIKTTIQQSLR
jgi:hypothetical protein